MTLHSVVRTDGGNEKLERTKGAENKGQRLCFNDPQSSVTPHLNDVWLYLAILKRQSYLNLTKPPLCKTMVYGSPM